MLVGFLQIVTVNTYRLYYKMSRGFWYLAVKIYAFTINDLIIP